MCVAAIAWHAHPRWRLVAIGNRDELHARPSTPLARYDHVLSGIDEVAGGAWLGVSEEGRFAIVTNRRGFGAPDAQRRSRGELVSYMLAEGDLPGSPEQFNPFNYLAVANDRLAYLTTTPENHAAALGHGVYGVSNGALDEPWPKTLALKHTLTDWLANDEGSLEPLFAILRSERLPELGIAPVEPSDIAIEPRDTPPFIRHPLYGTRCSTVVTVASDGTGRIAERRFDAAGGVTGDTALDFRWPAA